MSQYLGEFAALAGSLMYTASSTLFSQASRRVGSMALNRLRLLLAIGWLLLAHALLRTPLPLRLDSGRLFWLSLSGIIGLVIGDLFLFQSYIYIGPRLTMLMMALAPAIAALAAWLITGETLQPLEIAGIALTLAGIGWVISDRTRPRAGAQGSAAPTSRRAYLLGLLCGLGAAAGQALGLVTARLGLGGGFPAVSGTLVRMAAAAAALWSISLFGGQAAETVRTLRAQPRALWLALGGSFFGPFAGVTLSLYAIQHTEVGVASTLNSLSPIFLLPVGYFLLKERFGWQSVAGTLLAMAGVALLFL